MSTRVVTLLCALAGGLLACAQIAPIRAPAPTPAAGCNPIVLPWGRIEFGNNEVSIISQVDDPPALRLASPGPGGSLGKISFNRLRPDGKQEELVLLQGKADHRYPGTGEVTIHVKGPSMIGAGDAAMVEVVVLRFDHVEFTVPVFVSQIVGR